MVPVEEVMFGRMQISEGFRVCAFGDRGAVRVTEVSRELEIVCHLTTPP